MEYFLLQRLHSKNLNLDKFDFLDEQSTAPELCLSNCVLSSQDKTKDLDLTTTSSHLSIYLLLERLAAQRVNFSTPKRYSTDVTHSVTLRRNKFFNFFDTCLNSKFLLAKITLDKSTNYFKFNFKPNLVLDDNLLFYETFNLSLGKEVKVFLLCKFSCTSIRYFQ